MFLILNGVGIRVVPQEAPPGRIAEVTKSLVNLNVLTPPEFYSIANDLSTQSKEAHAKFWQDAFALGKNGELYPKHSIFSAVFAVPFYMTFGENGFAIAQFACSLLLLFSTYILVVRVFSKAYCISTLIVICLSTEVFTAYHFFGYSYDLHGTALIMLGLCLMRKSKLWGAFIAGLALLVRPSFILFLPLLPFAWNSICKKEIADAVVGYLAAASIFLFLNYLLWGDPFVTAYQRVPMFTEYGTMILDNHPIGFNIAVFLSDWSRKLFDSKIGFLRYNPCLFLLPIAAVKIWKLPARHFFLITTLAAVLPCIYFFSYEMWDMSFRGNRFMLTSVFLVLPSLIFTVGQFAENVRDLYRSSTVSE